MGVTLRDGLINWAVDETDTTLQIKLNRDSGQWLPHGEVLRCIIEDDSEGEAVIVIDGKELSLREFGRLLTVYAGWGMRIAFVPEELVHEQPKIKVRGPRRRRG